MAQHVAWLRSGDAPCCLRVAESAQRHWAAKFFGCGTTEGGARARGLEHRAGCRAEGGGRTFQTGAAVMRAQAEAKFADAALTSAPGTADPGR